MIQNLFDQGACFPSPYYTMEHSPYHVYTEAMNDLGIPYQPMIAGYVWDQYGCLMNMAKYGIFSKEPLHSKNEVQYNQRTLEIEEMRKTYREALMREAIICFLNGKSATTICYLGITPLCQLYLTN